MKISVITVTYNALDMLLKTAESVVGQDYADFEYVIVDGASTDGTVDKLKEGINGVTCWLSEPDGGIYEAMNKGVKLAKGDYCIFMNAGDRFVNGKVLSRVNHYLDGADVILGNELKLSEDGKIVGYTPSFKCFTTQNLFHGHISHQASFIKRQNLLEKPYDESLRLVSDWKYILECYFHENYNFKTVNIDICIFLEGGATTQYFEKGRSERQKVFEQFPEERHLWEKQIKPSLLLRAIRKVLFYLKRIQYSSRIKVY